MLTDEQRKKVIVEISAIIGSKEELINNLKEDIDELKIIKAGLESE